MSGENSSNKPKTDSSKRSARGTRSTRSARSTRTTVILLIAIVAVLAAGVLLLLFYPQPEEKPNDTDLQETPGTDERHDMIDINKLGTLSSAAFTTQAGEQFSLVIDMETFSLRLESEDSLFPGKMEEMDQMMYAATMLVNLTQLTDNADDGQLALFGFEYPRLKWRLNYFDGDSTVIELGDGLPTGDGSYIRAEGSREVYLIGSIQSSYLLKSPEDLYDIYYLPVPPSTEDEPTWAYLADLTLIKPDGDTIEIKRRSAEELADMPIGTSSFRLLQPFETDCNDYRIQTIFMEAATLIQPQTIIESNPKDLSVYGLDNPATLVVSMLTAPGDEYFRILRIGNYDAALGGRYVKLDGHNAVLLDTSGNYGFLDADPYELRQRIIWLHNINTVSSVEFDLDGAKRLLELSHDGEDLQGYLDGKELSVDNSRRLFTSALNIMASGSTDAAIPNDVPASYSITMNFTGGGSETLDLYPINDTQFLIVLDGESSGAYITRLILFQSLLNRFDILDAGGDLSRG